jgi:hypothetical protein
MPSIHSEQDLRIERLRDRHTAGLGQPAQEKPPLEPQPPPEEKLLPPEEPPSAAKVESFFFVFWLWQVGQGGVWFASEKRTIFSKGWPQSLHWYS